MKILGILTEDFSVYYDLVKELKSKEIPFISLSFNEKIPSNVGIIITTKEEKHKIKFRNVVEFSGIGTIDNALSKLTKENFYNLSIGIDPGERTGIAVIGDGKIVFTSQCKPEYVLKTVKKILEVNKAENTNIKIGHGAKTIRNRIINSLLHLNIQIEIVDESCTTNFRGGDIKSAEEIAKLNGFIVKNFIEISPTERELKHIQRESRIKSKNITISKELAEKVAKGKLTIEKAIEKQRKISRQI